MGSNNKVRRYRLKDVEIEKMGFEKNSNGRYRLSKEEEVELLKMRIMNAPISVVPDNATQNISKTESSNSMEVSAKRITSLDELLKQCNVDLTIWEVERYIANKWEMGEAGGKVTPLFQIKATLKRRTADNLNWEYVGDELIKKLNKHTPNYNTVPRPINKDAHLLIIDPSDSHFGKLVSSYENPDKPYNINIAKKRFIEGFEGILEKAERFNIDKVMIVLGNDIMHIDGAKSTTTAGTFQDSDSMFYDIFNTALESVVSVIEKIMQKYDVDVVFNASNHDYSGGWMLSRTVEAWFRNTKNVNVDSRITHRKYYKYGDNLIGTSHGDGAKLPDLPLHMANEAPEMWATSKFRYIYLHHIHHYNKIKFQTGKDYIGVTVEYLRSPSEADSWHLRNGWTGAPKAVEGFLHHKTLGQVGKFTHFFN